jgi:manganese/zinc/iron transport system substrate-binding protein
MQGPSFKAVLVCLSLLGLTGCWGSSSAAHHDDVSAKKSAQRLRIVVTTGMVADLVRHVVGEHGDVAALMGSGVDPHLFKPLLQHIKKLNEADVVFYSGLMLEGRMQDELRRSDRAKRPVVAVTKHLEELEKGFLRSPPEFEGHYDPHVWMDVVAWSRCADQVVETLSAIDGQHAEAYLQNAKSYQSELAELDIYVREVIASIPPSQRVLVTAHDAFGYFGRAYGVDVRSVQGVTTESEAGVRDVNKLVEFLVQSKIPAIFVESSVNEKNIHAVIEGAKSHGVSVRIGGELFSDAMGAEGTYEGTYIGMLDHNATMISLSLGGTAPAKGFRNQLSLRHE